MEFRELRAFVAVVEEGGFSPAARRLHLSQPALSQIVGSLERQLGVVLLVRSRSGTTPTEAGSALLLEARELISRHDAAVAAVRRHVPTPATGSGQLRIGIPLELPQDLLTAPLADLRRSHPEVTVRATHGSTSTQLAALRNDDLDLGLARQRPTGVDLDAVTILAEPLGVLLATDVADSIGTPTGVRLDDLAGLEWVGFPRTGSPAWYDEVAAILRSHGLDLGPPAPEGQSLIPQVKFAAVGSGRAFALAPSDWSEPLPEGITWTRLIGHPLVRRTWAVWPTVSRRHDVAVLVAALEAQHDARTGQNPQL